MDNKSIVTYLQQLGVCTVDADYRAYIDDWLDWYRGKVDKFHAYTVYNGIQRVGVERASLDMAKTVAEDWANLLLNERVQITVESEPLQARLDALLTANRFAVEGNRTVEMAFASGTGAFSLYKDAQGEPRIDYHAANCIWPLAWSGSRITECAFSSVEVRDGEKCVYLRMYRVGENGRYQIANRWIDYDSGKELSAPEGVQPDVDTGMQLPPFAIITPNIANNIDTTCPMGISVFANAIDALKAVDATFDSLRNEYILGRKRLMVPASMTKIQMAKDGDAAPIFDPTDMVFTAYQPTDGQADGFHDLSPEIRAEQHMTGLRTQLNVLSFKCGLGTGRYEFERSGGVKTATEVVSEQSDLYQSLQKHELSLREALVGLTQALLEMDGHGIVDVVVTFDDSIIQDKSTIRTEAREEVRDGLMSKFYYLTKVRGMSEADAEKELARIKQEGSITSDAIDFFSVRGVENP